METTTSGTDLVVAEVTMSRELEKLGFRLISGEDPEKGGCEYPHGTGATPNVVQNGAARTYDYNNGVWAVYDLGGLCWIRRKAVTRSEGEVIMDFLLRNGLRHGAYVPHSNACDTTRCGYCREVDPK